MRVMTTKDKSSVIVKYFRHYAYSPERWKDENSVTVDSHLKEIPLPVRKKKKRQTASLVYARLST